LSGNILDSLVVRGQDGKALPNINNINVLKLIAGGEGGIRTTPSIVEVSGF
jgi:hypothetical protein